MKEVERGTGMAGQHLWAALAAGVCKAEEEGECVRTRLGWMNAVEKFVCPLFINIQESGIEQQQQHGNFSGAWEPAPDTRAAGGGAGLCVCCCMAVLHSCKYVRLCMRRCGCVKSLLHSLLTTGVTMAVGQPPPGPLYNDHFPSKHYCARA